VKSLYRLAVAALVAITPVFASTLLPYGTAAGDFSLPKCDDCYVELLPSGSNTDKAVVTTDASLGNGSGPDTGGNTPASLTSLSFYLGGQTYNDVYISNNGIVTFTAPETVWDGAAFPSASVPSPAFAPYWADADTLSGTAGGTVWYRVDANSYGNPELVVTWDHVAAYGGTSTGPVNTFQMTIGANNVGQELVTYNYDELQWLFGSASNGGYPSTGFQINSTDYYNAPGTLTANELNLVTESNRVPATPGQLQFTLNVAQTPEPGSATLLFAAAGLTFAGRKRFRRWSCCK
jgi:hypothetical protein